MNYIMSENWKTCYVGYADIVGRLVNSLNVADLVAEEERPNNEGKVQLKGTPKKRTTHYVKRPGF